MPDMALELIKLLGPMGFIMWMVWRFQNHTIPRLAEENSRAQERQRSDFKEILGDQITKFDQMQKTQMEFFRVILTREQEVHTKQTQEIVDSVKDLTAEVRRVGQ